MKSTTKAFLRFSSSFVLLWGFATTVALLGTSSCGDRSTFDESLQDKVRNPNATPSRENFSQWKKLWSNKSWVIAWKGEASLPPGVKDVRNHIVYGILDHIGISTAFDQFSKAYKIVDDALDINFTTLTKVKKFALSGNSNISGFAHVTLKNDSSVWNQLFSFAGVSSAYSGMSSFEQNAFDMWDALESIPSQAWVEPDLISDLTEAFPELGGERDVSRVFGLIKGGQAYDYAASAGLPIPGNERKNVVVGVIDTGVDYGHDKLKDQMFKNPEEIADDKVDNDGNGYIDDVVGFDANYARNEVDPLPSPTPGAADLGGPGVPCPVNDSASGTTSGCGHGTHVAGLIAAKSTGSGALGVCQSCKIYSLRAAGRKVVAKEGGGFIDVGQGISDSAQIRALSYVLEFYDPNAGGTDSLYIQAINMSIGKIFRNRSIAFLIRSLQRNGVLVVAAAGNENTETPSYPAAYNSVLSVCALSLPSSEQESSDQVGLGTYAKASFSNFGEWVDICAPGTRIFSTWPGNETKTIPGTSMASPIVAGAAGYLMKLRANLTAEDVQDLLKHYANADDVYDVDKEPTSKYFQGDFRGNALYFYLGYGALNLENSVKALKNEGVRNFIANSSNLVGVQVPRGCIVSSVGIRSHYPFWHFFSSMPFVLGSFWITIRALHYRRRKQS